MNYVTVLCASALIILASSDLANAQSRAPNRFDPSGGGGVPSMPPVTSMPGQGAGNSGSAAGTALGTTAGSAATDAARNRSGQNCRYQRSQGGRIPEC